MHKNRRGKNEEEDELDTSPPLTWNIRSPGSKERCLLFLSTISTTTNIALTGAKRQAAQKKRFLVREVYDFGRSKEDNKELY